HLLTGHTHSQKTVTVLQSVCLLVPFIMSRKTPLWTIETTMTEHEDKPGGSDDDIFELLAPPLGGDSEELKRSPAQSGTGLEGLAALGGQLPPGFTQMFSQFATGSIFPTSSESDTSVNWELAHNLARQSAVADGDPSVGPRAE